MTVYAILLKMYSENQLPVLVQKGVLSATLLHQFEVYMWINARMKTDPKLKKTDAVMRASVEFDRSQQYIWKALRVMD